MHRGLSDTHGRLVSTLSPVLERTAPGHELMDALLSALPVQMAVLDRKGTITAVNEAWERAAAAHDVSGVADGSVGTDFLAVCGQAFGAFGAGAREVEAGIRAVLDGRQPLFTTEYPCVFHTGWRWFLLQASPLPGNLPGALVVHVDITERKITERKITERKLTEEEWANSLVRERVQRAELERGRPASIAGPAAAEAISAEAISAEAISAEPTSIARLRALEALTDTALSHLALDDLMRELLDRATAVMRVDNAAILLLEEDGKTLTARAARGPEEQVMGRVRVPVGRGFAGRIAASRKPLLLDDVSAHEVVTPLLREQMRSLVGVPLLVEDRLVGVVHVGSATPRHFTQQDVDLLQLVADRIGPAVERARLYAAEQEARARAEEALARATASEAQATERAEELRTILETIADGVAVFDQAGHILDSNRALLEMFAYERMPGYETMSAADRTRLLRVRDIAGVPIPPEQLPVSRALRGEVVRGPSADNLVRAADGRELEVNISAAPLRDRDGRVVGAVAVMRDVSRHRRLEREREEARANELVLKETAQRLDEFLATAAHELRSPLGVTMTAIDLAATRVERLAATITAKNPDVAHRIDSIRSCLDEANQSVDRLSRMVSLLFDTTPLRAGSLEVHRKPCDLAALVREQVAALRKAHSHRVIRIETPDDLPVRVAADADRIGQVVTNYLSNALKYSAEDQPVDVRVELEGPLARVSVRDRGPGMPRSEQERIWERFYRVRGIRVRSGQSTGLGLGLHISKMIVERHGGQVGVESAVGVGSTFWFTLPTSPRRP